jgi:hypothetical protein
MWVFAAVLHDQVALGMGKRSVSKTLASSDEPGTENTGAKYLV